MSRSSPPVLAALLVASLVGLAWMGGPAGAADAKGELKKAVERGAVLYKKRWAAGSKTCVACHAAGRNKLHAKRANEYPKYDKALRKVVTLQQKLNQMIVSKSKGKALTLGSVDLNALEAYIKTLK